MRGPVIWVTGLSGTGKTTLCAAVRDRLRPHGRGVVTLDGDAVRAAFGHDLGYAEADRIRHIERVQRLARVLADQDVVVLVAALYSNPALLAWNRAHLPGYQEVYLRASVPALAARDTKGLYRMPANGTPMHVVGVDIPFAPPDRPDVVFDVETFQDVRAMAATVLDAVVSADVSVAGAAR
jgi:adenylylsulfate kinase-like enzyme